MTCTAEVLPMIAVCFLLAALLHADMNSGSLNPGAHKQGQASLKDGNNIWVYQQRWWLYEIQSPFFPSSISLFSQVKSLF